MVGLAECTNKELRMAWEMYIRLFQTSLLLKNEESLDNKSIKGSKHLKIAMEPSEGGWHPSEGGVNLTCKWNPSEGKWHPSEGGTLYL